MSLRDQPPASARVVRVVAALIERDGAYLITQRRAGAVLPLLWEFPGGRVEEGEQDAQAVQREVAHRLGARVECGARLSTVRHPYEAYTVELHLYQCTLPDGVEPGVCAVHAFRWVKSDEFERYTFTPADEASMSALLGERVARS